MATATLPPGSLQRMVRRIWEKHPDKRPGHICYDFPVGANASLLEDQLRIGFNARLRRYTRWASLALVGLTDVASGLTYTDELKLEARAEPEVVHSDHANFPSVPGWSFGVLVKTTAVKTVQLERSGLNLRKTPIELTVRSSTKPVEISLQHSK